MEESLPSEFWQGITEFNRGEFYACHDTLEAIWIPCVGPEKQLYQGIIQIAVAIYHLSNHNWRGTVILMGEGLNRLRHYPDEFAELDLGQFRAEIAEILSILQSLGADRVAEFQWSQPVQTADHAALEQPSPAATTTKTDTPATPEMANDPRITHPRPIIQKVGLTLGN